MNNEGKFATVPGERVILYLEDDDATAYLFDRIVRDLSSTAHLYRVIDCASAIAFLRQEEPFIGAPLPHVLVLDAHVGKDSGFTVLRAVRSEPLFARLPVIIFTSSNDDSDRIEASQGHADGYLLKSGELSAFTSAAELALCLAA
jgi:CheY-like chemotaxis protein